METETLKTKRTDIMLVDPRNLVIEEGFNKRVDYGDIPALALSIVQFGLIDAVKAHKVRGEEKYIVTDGHRRQAALMLAIENHNKGVKGFEDISLIERVPVLPASANLKERLYIMAITGETKKVLTDMEKVEMYEALLEMGKEEGKKRSDTIREICANLGISQAAVYNTLKISELSDSIKSKIASNIISATTVVAIVRELKDPVQQEKAVEAAIANAAKLSEASGKKVKATAKDVKGLKSKTPMARIQEIVDKLETNKVNNVRANALKALLKAIEEKQSSHKLYELFV